MWSAESQGCQPRAIVDSYRLLLELPPICLLSDVLPTVFIMLYPIIYPCMLHENLMRTTLSTKYFVMKCHNSQCNT